MKAGSGSEEQTRAMALRLFQRRVDVIHERGGDFLITNLKIDTSKGVKHFGAVEIAKTILRRLGYVTVDVDNHQSADASLNREIQQIRGTLYLDEYASTMALHEAGHALADAIFYRSIARHSGFNWVVGYHPLDLFGRAHVRMDGTVPVLVRQSEELAILCHRTLLWMLGWNSEHCDPRWGSLVPDSVSMRYEKTDSTYAALARAIVDVLKDASIRRAEMSLSYADCRVSDVGMTYPTGAVSVRPTEAIRKAWARFFRYYRVRPGDETGFLAFLHSMPWEGFREYMSVQVGEYLYPPQETGVTSTWREADVLRWMHNTRWSR